MTDQDAVLDAVKAERAEMARAINLARHGRDWPDECRCSACCFDLSILDALCLAAYAQGLAAGKVEADET